MSMGAYNNITIRRMVKSQGVTVQINNAWIGQI